jgi:rhodanese-related sulfurtransferase/thiol-disulfide isomerase/thioredoxin
MKIFIAVFISLMFVITVFAQETSPALIEVDSFAAKAIREVKPQIIDVRTPEEFKTNHIRGAIAVNLKENNYLNRLNQFDKTKPVFIYAIQSSRPDVLAKELQEIGYTNVYELKGGIAAWIGKGYPYYSSMKSNFSKTDYNKIIKDNKIVLVEIGTKYCGLCVKAKRIIDSLQNNANNSYKIIELELYDNPQLVANIQEVDAVPTLLLYKEGKINWKRTGLNFNKDDIEKQIEKAQHD